MPASSSEGPRVVRVVSVGGLTKSELREELRRNAIAMNELAERLFADQRFTPSPTRYSVTTVELTVRELGLARGGTNADIAAQAAARGLGSCPMELGPHLRLHYRDQPEGFVGMPAREQRAPSGSLTVVSEPLSDDEEVPRGFYLRRIDGVLWLRGYRCGAEHVWDADDRLLFRRLSAADSMGAP